MTNRRNGKSVVLTVNNCGPYINRRFLDVSRRAPREIGFIRDGIVPVRVGTERLRAAEEDAWALLFRHQLHELAEPEPLVGA